jgi:hypothetical protein
MNRHDLSVAAGNAEAVNMESEGILGKFRRHKQEPKVFWNWGHALSRYDVSDAVGPIAAPFRTH